MNQAQRMMFDALLEQVLASLPQRLHELLEEAPLVVEDRPSRHLLREFGLDHDDQSLCGLYTGVPLTERSVTEGVEPPESIQIFREGVVMQAGGWERSEDEDGRPQGGADAVAGEIRITLLHEMGHHFGLEEDELAELGYE